MIILREEEVLSDFFEVHDVKSRIDRYWNEGDSFAIIPRTAAKFLKLIEQFIKHGPKYVQKRHFVLFSGKALPSAVFTVCSCPRAEDLIANNSDVLVGEAVESQIMVLPFSSAFPLINQWLWSKMRFKPLHVFNGLSRYRSLNKCLTNSPNSMLCLDETSIGLVLKLFGHQVFRNVVRINLKGCYTNPGTVTGLQEMFPAAKIQHIYGTPRDMGFLATVTLESSRLVAHPLPGVSLHCDTRYQVTIQSAFAARGLITEDGFRPLEDAWEDKSGEIKPTSNDAWILER